MSITIGGLCGQCSYNKGGYCDYIERDDNDYPHNNRDYAGIEVHAADDHGLDVQMRVSDNFGCVKFTSK